MESSEYARFRADGTGEGASRQGPVVDYESVRDARVQAAAEAKAAAAHARAKSRVGRFVVPQAVSDAADAALQAVAQHSTITRGARNRGGHEDGSGQRTTEPMAEDGNEVNRVDRAGFAVFDRSSFFLS